MSETKKSRLPLGLRIVAYAFIIGLMLSIVIPNLLPAKVTKAQNACVVNLKQIAGAQRSWSLEMKKGPGETVDAGEVAKFFRGGILPTCPAGGSYELHQVKDKPTCSLGAALGHSLP
jgi:hypothetical protein